jgi:hypothetical protein
MRDLRAFRFNPESRRGANGTSEFYQVVESLPEILGSLVIDATALSISISREAISNPDSLVPFLELADRFRLGG